MFLSQVYNNYYYHIYINSNFNVSSYKMFIVRGNLHQIQVIPHTYQSNHSLQFIINNNLK